MELFTRSEIDGPGDGLGLGDSERLESLGYLECSMLLASTFFVAAEWGGIGGDEGGGMGGGGGGWGGDGGGVGGRGMDGGTHPHPTIPNPGPTRSTY